MKSIYFVLITLLLASCSKNNLNDNPSDLYLDDGIRPSSIIHDGGLRDYQLYIPPGYNGTDPLPVVINFHGFDGDAYEYLINSIDQFYNQKDLVKLIEDNGFSNVEFRNLSNGVSAIHSGWKI